MMDERLLAVLGCPFDNAELKLIGGRLICTECGQVFQIKDGIPQMLITDYSNDETAKNK